MHYYNYVNLKNFLRRAFINFYNFYIEKPYTFGCRKLFWQLPYNVGIYINLANAWTDINSGRRTKLENTIRYPSKDYRRASVIYINCVLELMGRFPLLLIVILPVYFGLFPRLSFWKDILFYSDVSLETQFFFTFKSHLKVITISNLMSSEMYSNA